MKILVHQIFYRPEPIGAGTYAGEMCEWLARKGHSTRVVCPPPYYPFWKVQPPYKAGAYRSEIIAGVAVFRCPIWAPSRPRGWKRLLHTISFMVSSAPVMFREILMRPDVVLVVEPSFLNALSSLLFAKCSGALAWLHVQDFELDLAFDLQQFRSPRVHGWVRAFESWVMKRFDVVSTISSRMLERLDDKGISEPRRVLFPNWVDTSFIYPLHEPAHSGGKVIALYSGSAGAKQGLDVLIDAARLLQEQANIEIVICASGTESLRDRALGLANVRFLPLQPRESLNELLNSAGIHLLPQNPSAADLVMPSKLLGMAASGRPIIATAEPETEIANVVSSCGIVVRPGDPAALASAIMELAADPDRCRELGRRARAVALAAWEMNTVLTAFERELLSRLPRSQAIPQEAS